MNITQDLIKMQMDIIMGVIDAEGKCGQSSRLYAYKIKQFEGEIILLKNQNVILQTKVEKLLKNICLNKKRDTRLEG